MRALVGRASRRSHKNQSIQCLATLFSHILASCPGHRLASYSVSAQKLLPLSKEKGKFLHHKARMPVQDRAAHLFLVRSASPLHPLLFLAVRITCRVCYTLYSSPSLSPHNPSHFLRCSGQHPSHPPATTSATVAGAAGRASTWSRVRRKHNTEYTHQPCEAPAGQV